ncbi:pilus assembly protein PilC [bacterium SM23_57]|nr:MAG: pilus assembly protein PilC [bacterium SM23_57]
MPVYQWKGRTTAKKEISGELEAKDRKELASKLRERKVVLTDASAKPMEIKLPAMAKKITVRDLGIFSRLFATMVNAGLPIDQCLDILREQVPNKTFSKVIAEIHQSVTGGASMAEALSKHKKVFDNLYIHMVEAGETGGVLAVIFRRLASYLEKADALRRKVKGAMMYPIAVMTVAIGATVFLLLKVIPVFAKMFADMGATLPKPTQIVIGVSEFLQQYFLYGLIMIIGFIVLYRRYRKTETGKLVTDRLFLKLPILGNVIRKTAVARFTRTLGTLISSGVPILQGLDITAKTSGNMVIQRALQATRKSISEGKNISVPLQESGVFPTMVVQLISVGEQTGRLAEMLEKIADFFDEEVETAVQAMTSLIEPIVIVFMGVVIGGLLIAMYLPMFDLIGAIN